MTIAPDISHLKPPIKMTYTGMKQAIHALEVGTSEVRETLLNEAQLVYECKVCFSLFRSIGNIVAHKRDFCQSKSSDTCQFFSGTSDQASRNISRGNLSTVILEPEDAECCADIDSWNYENYSPSMELIKTAGIIEDIQSSPLCDKLNPNLQKGNSRSIRSVVKDLIAKVQPKPHATPYHPLTDITSSDQSRLLNVHLDTIATNKNGKYQCVTDHNNPCPNKFMRQGSFDNRWTVAANQESAYSSSIGLSACEASSREGLNGKAEWSTRYPCCYCTSDFAHPRSLKAHILRVHKKSLEVAIERVRWAKKKAVQRRKQVVELHVSPKSHTNVSATGKPLFETSNPNDLNMYSLKRVGVKIKKMPFTKDEIRKLIDSDNDDVNGPSEDNSVDGGTNENEMEKAENNDSCDKGVQETASETAPEPCPEIVSKELSKHYDRRKLNCKLCFKSLKNTALLRSHVANKHLGLKRWSCSICQHGSWTKEQVIRRCENRHRLRKGMLVVNENPVEVYFKRYQNAFKGGCHLNGSTNGSEATNDDGSSTPAFVSQPDSCDADDVSQKELTSGSDVAEAASSAHMSPAKTSEASDLRSRRMILSPISRNKRHKSELLSSTLIDGTEDNMEVDSFVLSNGVARDLGLEEDSIGHQDTKDDESDASSEVSFTVPSMSKKDSHSSTTETASNKKTRRVSRTRDSSVSKS